MLNQYSITADMCNLFVSYLHCTAGVELVDLAAVGEQHGCFQDVFMLRSYSSQLY